MREELKEIEKKLLDLGWVQSTTPNPDDDIPDTTSFIKAYGEDVVGIEIALEPFSLNCFGRYGVCGIFIVKYSNPFPYLRSDIREMNNLIQEAEIELITNGVPFRPSYAFMKNTEHYLGKNLDLREKYHLDEFEKEDWIRD